VREADGGPSNAEKVAKYLLTHNLPDYLIERMRSNSKNISRFDPDIASYKSFSLSTKMRIQADRELARAIQETKDIAKRSVMAEMFQKASNFYWG
jgi:hypothetical protein